jgi:hypothetical protein
MSVDNEREESQAEIWEQMREEALLGHTQQEDNPPPEDEDEQ